jgi:threonine/homoserine/homoserine lactone efflux protein
MWLLITFITIWALSPGPIAVMTLHVSRKHGLMAGTAVSAGATLTAALMVLMGLVIHLAGFSAILDSEGMIIIERVGAVGIILMGFYAGYKSLWTVATDGNHSDTMQSVNKVGFIQGAMVMATYIPQALIYYNMIVPQTVDTDTIMTAIIALGTLKVILIFGWHLGIAVVATRVQNWGGGSQRFSKAFEMATAGLIMVLGINMLF